MGIFVGIDLKSKYFFKLVICCTHCYSSANTLLNTNLLICVSLERREENEMGKNKNVGEREGEDIKENDNLFQYRSSHVTSSIYYEILYISFTLLPLLQLLLRKR